MCPPWQLLRRREDVEILQCSGSLKVLKTTPTNLSRHHDEERCRAILNAHHPETSPVLLLASSLVKKDRIVSCNSVLQLDCVAQLTHILPQSLRVALIDHFRNDILICRLLFFFFPSFAAPRIPPCPLSRVESRLAASGVR